MTTHRHSRSRTYRTWSNMLTRCRNVNYTNYKHYGGRGITVCARWETFESFLADMGERPIGKTLDRIDVNGNYELNNCRWATPQEQADNARQNVLLTAAGETLNVSQWAKKLGIPRGTIFSRLAKGYAVEHALSRRSFRGIGRQP